MRTTHLAAAVVGIGAAVLGHLELPVSEAELSPDERTLVQLLCDLLAPTLARLQ